MDTINTALLRAYVELQNAAGAVRERATRRDGQNSLEYIVAVVFIVVAAGVGFKIAGGDIKDTASKFVDTVLGNK